MEFFECRSVFFYNLIRIIIGQIVPLHFIKTIKQKKKIVIFMKISNKLISKIIYQCKVYNLKFLNFA